MNYIHILKSKNTARPWFQTNKRLGIKAADKLFTDCCACNIRADECEIQISMPDTPLGGAGDYQEKLLNWQTPGFQCSYEETYSQIRCGDGFGCNANPRKKFGMALRMDARWGW